MLKMEDGDIFNIVEGYTEMDKIALILIRTLMIIPMIFNIV